MEDTTPLAPNPPSSTTPSAPARLAAKNSYFPLVPEEGTADSPDVTMHSDHGPSLVPVITPRSGGLKRKISDTGSSYRNTSAKLNPEIATPVTSWYSRSKPASVPPARSEAHSTVMGEDLDADDRDRNSYEEGGARGLPTLDPSDRPVILMCDDNPDMRLWISSLLQTDYNVIEARNGSAALDILATVIPDLVRPPRSRGLR